MGHRGLHQRADGSEGAEGSRRGVRGFRAPQEAPDHRHAQLRDPGGDAVEVPAE